MTTTGDPAVEPEALRASVREKDREVACHPDGDCHKPQQSPQPPQLKGPNHVDP
jgi:hypothetical protein